MKYAPSHEWVRVEDGVATVGITYHAQGQLGEVVYVELPALGKFICSGDEVAVLESTKAAADVYTPVSGKVIAVNEKLASDIQAINRLPETEGWLFKVELSDSGELDALLDHTAYTQSYK